MSDPERPRIELHSTPVDVAVQVIAVVGLMLSGVVVVGYWPGLPLSVPVHFGADGAPDAWGSKSSLLFLAGIELLVFVMLTGLERAPQRLHRGPTRTPVDSRRLLASLKAVVVWVLTIGLWRTCLVAAGQAEGLGNWFLPVTLLAIFGTIAIFLVRGARAR